MGLGVLGLAPTWWIRGRSKDRSTYYIVVHKLSNINITILLITLVTKSHDPPRPLVP